MGQMLENNGGTSKDVSYEGLGSLLLTTSELYATLVKVEPIINSWPITFQSDDPSEPNLICPRVLLPGRRATTLLVSPTGPRKPEYTQVFAINRLRYLDSLAGLFFDRWRR